MELTSSFAALAGGAPPVSETVEELREWFELKLLMESLRFTVEEMKR